jgi:hypothetical protein
MSLRALFPEALAYVTTALQPVTTPDMMTNFNNLVVIVLYFTLLCYWTFSAGVSKFSQSLSNVLAKIGRIGRFGFMAVLGVGYMNTWMIRVGLLSSRIWYLLHDWLQLA